MATSTSTMALAGENETMPTGSARHAMHARAHCEQERQERHDTRDDRVLRLEGRVQDGRRGQPHRLREEAAGHVGGRKDQAKGDPDREAARHLERGGDEEREPDVLRRVARDGEDARHPREADDEPDPLRRSDERAGERRADDEAPDPARHEGPGDRLTKCDRLQHQRTTCSIEAMLSRVYMIMRAASAGPMARRTIITAPTFTMKLTLASLIWVAACMTPTRTPATKEAIKIGPLTKIATWRRVEKSSSAWSGLKQSSGAENPRADASRRRPRRA